MAVIDAAVNALSRIPPPLLIILTPVALVAALLLSVRAYTNIRYRLELNTFLKPSSTPRTPPKVPYTYPWLGSALDFLVPKPGLFWQNLFKYHPRNSGACTLHLGGRSTHIIFDPTAVQHLFKNKTVTRHQQNIELLSKGFGMTVDMVHNFYGRGEEVDEKGMTAVQQQEKVNDDHLLRTSAVNELTAEFTNHFKATLDKELKTKDEVYEGGFFEWLRPRMFFSSSNALFGQRYLEIFPELESIFWDFDQSFLDMYFGIPRWIKPKPYETRDKVLEGMVKIQEICRAESNDNPVDPDGPIQWEPIWGSRCNRARQMYYSSRNMNNHGRAVADLGMMFGLNSNAIPATMWMMFHILNPTASGDKTLYPRIMDEVKTAQKPDGSLDITHLISLPLLQSVYQEVLRLYVDVLVTRELNEDLVLPLEGGQRQVLLRKGGILIAPSYLGHHDEAAWTNPPVETFYADRYLKQDPETGKTTFSMTGTNGKLFPFGGGRTICPGRVFAKQEVLGAAAMLLLSFEYEPVGFVDLEGREIGDVPGLKEAFAGTGAMNADGDLKVRMRRRQG